MLQFTSVGACRLLLPSSPATTCLDAEQRDGGGVVAAQLRLPRLRPRLPPLQEGSGLATLQPQVVADVRRSRCGTVLSFRPTLRCIDHAICWLPGTYTPGS